MAKVMETLSLVENIVRLRRAERLPEAVNDVAPVRRSLERQLGSTLTRSRTARIFGVSQTALDRWVDNGQIPTVIAPSGRGEVPRQVVIELKEAIDRLKGRGIARHPLAAALDERRAAGLKLSELAHGEGRARTERGHRMAERRSLAYHRAIASRLDDRLVADARDRIDSLEEGGHLDPRHGDAWREILAHPIAEIAKAIAADDERARDLHQTSPFAGVLNEHERRQIIEAVQ